MKSCGAFWFRAEIERSQTILFTHRSYVCHRFDTGAGLVEGATDYLMFIAQGVVIDGIDSQRIYPPLVFVKNDKLYDILIKSLPQDYHIIRV